MQGGIRAVILRQQPEGKLNRAARLRRVQGHCDFASERRGAPLTIACCKDGTCKDSGADCPTSAPESVTPAGSVTTSLRGSQCIHHCMLKLEKHGYICELDPSKNNSVHGAYFRRILLAQHSKDHLARDLPMTMQPPTRCPRSSAAMAYGLIYVGLLASSVLVLAIRTGEVMQLP